MRWNKLAGVLLGALGVVGLVIALWPVSLQTAQIPFSIPDGLAGTLTLKEADQVRVGVKSEISLNIVIDQVKNATKELVFQSKLEFNNLEVNPRGEGSVTVDPSKPFELKWGLLPSKKGEYTGTLWLFTDSQTGEKQLILARPIKIVANTLFGLSYLSARIFCIFGMIAGLVLFFLPTVIIKKPL